ncbi:MAG: hypothetical protein K8J08_02650 [Thermoanaerobaculia bacterium]|nr:hypothetical protein [Thermoanaerobaculia bacterium]
MRSSTNAIINFFWGAVVGGFVGFFVMGREARDWFELLGSTVLVAVVFGLLAVFLGQRFLDRIFDWLARFSM